MQYGQQHDRTWAMPIFIVIAAGFIGMLASTVAADLIVFGDSLSDVGNIYRLTTRLTLAPDIPDPQAGYFSGRFSDGPVWVDRLAFRLGESPLVSSLNGGTNYAYGSARVLEDGLFAPRLSQQIKMHREVIQKSDWFVIWAGANDLQNADLSDLPKSLQIAKDAAIEINASVDRLYEQGAKQLLVMNLPDSSRLPYTVLMVDQTQRDNLFQVTTVFNEELDRQLTASRVARPDLRLVTFDANRWFQDVVSSPLSFGLTNVTESAAPFYSNGLLAGFAKEPPGSADDLKTHAFFDGLHPTSYLHGLLGDRVADALLVPEPNSFVLGMVTFLWLVNSRRLTSGMKGA